MSNIYESPSSHKSKTYNGCTNLREKKNTNITVKRIAKPQGERLNEEKEKNRLKTT